MIAAVIPCQRSGSKKRLLDALNITFGQTRYTRALYQGHRGMQCGRNNANSIDVF